MCILPLLHLVENECRTLIVENVLVSVFCDSMPFLNWSNYTLPDWHIIIITPCRCNIWHYFCLSRLCCKLNESVYMWEEEVIILNTTDITLRSCPGLVDKSRVGGTEASIQWATLHICFGLFSTSSQCFINASYYLCRRNCIEHHPLGTPT